MSIGALSSLGLGSNGALSYDIIDKLKNADESAIIGRIDRDISKNTTLSSSLTSLTSKLEALQKSADTLGSASTYLEKNTTTDGTSVKATTSFGTVDQNIHLDVISLAQRDIYTSNTVSDKDAILTNSSESITYEYGATNFTIDINGMTLEELKDEINTQSNGDIVASVLNVGGANPYELVLKGKDTGDSNTITITGSTTLTMGSISTAKDAEVEYDGITIHRASNTFDDLITGVSLELKEAGVTDITIEKNKIAMKENITQFVSDYNALITDLNNYTSYNSETKTAGTFQGVSQVRSLKTDVQNILSNFISGGKTIADFGMSIDSDGKIEVDNDVQDTAMNDDLDTMIAFFAGTSPEGVFVSFESHLNDLLNDSNSALTLYSDFLSTQATTYEDSKTDAQKRLDDKYEIMAKKFAAYDNIINQFNNSFSALQSIINQQNSSNG